VGFLCGDAWQKVAMGTVTREQVAKKAGKSVRTVRSWETKGMLPRALPDISEGQARFHEMQLVPGRSWADVDHVIIQSKSIYFVMKDTCEHGDNIVVRMPTRAAQAVEKRLDSEE